MYDEYRVLYYQVLVERTPLVFILTVGGVFISDLYCVYLAVWSQRRNALLASPCSDKPTFYWELQTWTV